MKISVKKCPQCGGKIQMDEVTAKHFCMYCRSELVLREEEKSKNKPEPVKIKPKKQESELEKPPGSFGCLGIIIPLVVIIVILLVRFEPIGNRNIRPRLIEVSYEQFVDINYLVEFMNFRPTRAEVMLMDLTTRQSYESQILYPSDNFEYYTRLDFRFSTRDSTFSGLLIHRVTYFAGINFDDEFTVDEVKEMIMNSQDVDVQVIHEGTFREGILFVVDGIVIEIISIEHNLLRNVGIRYE